MTITVPSALDLRAVAGEPRQFRAVLNDVTVTASGTGGSAVAWTATVSATGFRIRRGRSWSPVDGPSVTYRSGPALAVPAGVSCTPGQSGTAPVDLRSATTAFRCFGRSPLTAPSVSWNATVTVTMGRAALAGSYAGTIVHSVY